MSAKIKEKKIDLVAYWKGLTLGYMMLAWIVLVFFLRFKEWILIPALLVYLLASAVVCNAYVIGMIGNMYYFLREPEKAKKFYAIAVKKNTRNVKALYNYALDALHEGRADEALPIFQRAEKLNVKVLFDKLIPLAVSSCYWVLGDIDKAISTIEDLQKKYKFDILVEMQEIHNKNWNFSVLQDGVKRISQCETTEEVLTCMFNLFGTLIKQNTEGSDERNQKLVQSILSYIEKNFATDISMDDLTEKFHVSRTYISRLLKKYAGKSFQKYLTDVRFKHVEKLIADDRYKQYEIAEMVGYKDFGYYIKVFKKRYGITPNEFRKHI